MIKRRLTILLIFCLMIINLSLSSYQFGKNKVQEEKLRWSVIETLHFDIYFPEGADDFGRMAALLAEETYYYLLEAFRIPLNERIPIIFYESHKEFQVTNIIYPLLSEGVGGFTESLKNRVVIPYDGSYKKLEEILIHELTHAYENSLDSMLSAARYLNLGRFVYPFWFSEGLPEYLSVGGQDNYNNMFIIDMILNDYFTSLERQHGFYAYRMGESFLTYIDEVYGRDKVMEIFYTLRLTGNMDKVCEKIFGMNFEEIQLRWRNHLKRKYVPYITDYDIPYEVYQRYTDHRKSGAFYNYAPRFSNDGKKFVYFSIHKNRISLFSQHSSGIFDPELLLVGEKTGRFEQFHFLRSNIVWFPDNVHFGFIAKTKYGDVFYKFSTDRNRVVEEHDFFEFDALYEMDLDLTGERLVFSGQKNMQNDIYIYNFETNTVDRITNDHYYNHQPRWSPDGKKIVFTSERTLKSEAKYDHIFNRLTNQIYYFDIEKESFYQLTFDEFNNFAPIWDSQSKKVIFISERDNVANFEIIDLENNKRAKVTQTLSGVFIGDLQENDEKLIFSVFFNNGWNIYSKDKPLEDLDYFEHQRKEKIVFIDDFYDRFEIDRYRFFGRKPKQKSDRRVRSLDSEVNKDLVGEFREAWRRELDRKPDTDLYPPKINPYRVRFFLDRLWGGVAYSSAYGTFGQLYLGFTDIMGNHVMTLMMGLSGDIEYSNFMYSYIYLARRIDYGFSVFYLNDDTTYYVRPPLYITDNLFTNYINIREQDKGFSIIKRYPFNRFWRLELENTLFKRTLFYDYYHPISRDWYRFDKDSELVYRPRARIVHDNVLFGPTGPMSGWRGSFSLSRSFGEHRRNYYTNYLDLRTYTLMGRRFSFANRLIAGFSSGENPQVFSLDGFKGIRGYSGDREGHKKVLTTLELRYPFVDYFALGFPLPIAFQGIRGSLFTDIGAVWDNHSDFRGMKNGKLHHINMGFGFGPRVNLGYFVLKLDIAWETNFSGTSKPSYFLSLSEDF